MTPGTRRRSVLVAMSGGVDSSVAAALLVDAGHDVVGVTMKLWGGEGDSGCCSVSDVDDARRVAQQLGIDHVVFNFADDFTARVVEPYVAAHAGGATPNPCIECNRHLKFDRLLRRARQLGFDAVATGHHARVEVTPGGAHGGPVRRLARGADRAKDQSYVLHMLDQDALAHVLLPVGAMTKDEVRARARRLGLRTAAKPDSQEVCFVSSSVGRRGFLAGRLALTPGHVVDTSGRRVGEVAAVQLVTVGQRRGIGPGGSAEARYVVDVDVDAGVVTIGAAAELDRDGEAVQDVVWSSGPPDGDVLVQCSAHGVPRRATIVPGGDGRSARVTWEAPQRRVAPGQSLAFYDIDDRYVLGGGTVTVRR